MESAKDGEAAVNSDTKHIFRMQSSNSHGYSIPTLSDVSKLLDLSQKEEIYTHFDDVTLVMNETENGTGNLHLTNLKLIWVNSDPSKVSYSFPYKSLMFHAISRDTNLFKNPCIFIQLNLTEEEEDNQSVLLSPNDPSLLESMFHQISKMSTLGDTYSSDQEEEPDCEIYEEE